MLFLIGFYLFILIFLFLHAYFSVEKIKPYKTSIQPLFLELSNIDEKELSRLLDEDKIRSVFQKSRLLIRRREREIEQNPQEASEKTTNSKTKNVSSTKQIVEITEEIETKAEPTRSKTDEIIKHEKESKSKFSIDRNVKKIYHLIKPYRKFFSEDELRAISMFLEDLNKCAKEPSVVSDFSFETTEYETSFNILRKVTIGEHTKNVLENILKKLNEYPGLTNKFAPRFIVAALFHDAGKLSIYRKRFLESDSDYRMLDHPQISYSILKEFLKIEDDSEYDQMTLDAIRLHHKPIRLELCTNQILKALKEADHLARRDEILKNAQYLKSLFDIIEKSALIEKIIEKYSEMKAQKYSDSDFEDSSRRRLSTLNLSRFGKIFFVRSGWLLIFKPLYFEIIESILSEKKILAREEVLSRLEFEQTSLELLLKYDLIDEDVLEKTVVIKNRIRNRERKIFLKDYLALRIEKLNLLESNIKDEYVQSITSIEFV